MGSDVVKMFVVVSEAVGQAVVLQKVACKAFEASVLVTEAVARQVVPRSLLLAPPPSVSMEL